MIARMYVIRDVKSELYGKPFLFVNDAMAMRSFGHAVTGADQAMSDHAEDFVLYFIGTYDDVSGLVTPNDPIRIVGGVEMVRQRGIDKQRMAELQAEIDKLNGESEGHA